MTSSEFSELYRQHYGKLYFFLLNYVRNKQQAEDVAATSFLKAWQHRQKLNGNFKSWLYQIAVNEAKMSWRKESHNHESIEDHQNLKDPKDFTKESEHRQELARATHAALLLSPKLREAMDCALRGFTLKESAGEMNTPTGTAGRRLFMARQKVRELCAA